MGRYRSRVTGSIVNVSDERGESLGAGYERVDEEPKPKRSARKPAAEKPSDDGDA